MKKKKTILTIICTVFALVLLIVLLRTPSDTISLFWWHLLHRDNVNIGNLTIRMPRNWIAVRDNKGLTLGRIPEGTGLITADYGKITLESLKSKPVAFQTRNVAEYNEFDSLTVHRNSGFLARTARKNDSIDAVISFPDDNFYFSFEGSLEAYDEFLKFVNSATPRKWNQ